MELSEYTGSRRQSTAKRNPVSVKCTLHATNVRLNWCNTIVVHVEGRLFVVTHIS